MNANLYRSTLLFIFMSLLAGLAVAGTNEFQPYTFAYQALLTDGSDNPLGNTYATADLKISIYNPAGNCLLYQETDTAVAIDSKSLVAVRVGSPVGSTKRTTSDPGLTMTSVYSNANVAAVNAANCPTGYTPLVGDSRVLRVTVTVPSGGATTVTLSDAFLDSVPSAHVADTLQGLIPSSFIQVSGAVTQANIGTLVGGVDASTLHNHDSRYAMINGSASQGFSASSVSATGNITTTSGNIGVGTATPTTDLQIKRAGAATLDLDGTLGTGSTLTLAFTNSGAQRGAIVAKDNANGLVFYSGTNPALQIDSSSNALFSASMAIQGTLGLGQYNSATEPALITYLTTSGATAKGTTWVNSTTNVLRYWDGSAAQSVASLNSVVNTLTAGTGVTMTGTPTNPIVSVTYGTAAGTALQGNAAAGGDLSGTFNTLKVQMLQGTSVDMLTTAPAAGNVLTYNGTKWAPLAPAPSGITSLNTLTSAAQTIAGSGNIAVTSSVATHTISLTGIVPLANGGTGANIAAVAGGPVYSTATGFAVGNSGTSGQVYTSGGTGAPTWTTASNANVASSLVQRDATGNFTAGTITANLTGAASFNVLKSGDSMTGSLVINAPAGFTSDLTNYQVNSITQFRVNSAGTVTANKFIGDGSGLTGLSSGTVTSVGIGLPTSVFSNGPIVTSSGTLTAAFISQPANTVFAGPNGAAGTPTFRNLVLADLPTLGTVSPINAVLATGDTFTVAFNKLQGQVSVANSGVANAIMKDGSVTYTGNQSFGGYNATSIGSLNASNMSASGTLGVNALAPAGQFEVDSANSTTIALVVKGSTSQSVDYFQVRNSLGNSVAGIDSFGRFYGNGSGLTGIAAVPGGSSSQVQFNSSGFMAGANNMYWDNSNSRLGIGTSAPTANLQVIGNTNLATVVSISGSSVQSTDIFQVKSNAGGIFFDVDQNGNVGIDTTPTSALDVAGLAKFRAALVKKNTGSPTNLMEIQDQSAFTLTKIDSSGNLFEANQLTVGSANSVTLPFAATTTIQSRGAYETPLAIVANSLQSSDILDITNSGGSLKYVSVDSSGALHMGNMAATIDAVVNRQYLDGAVSATSGGYLRRDGTVTLTGDWNAGNNNKIVGVKALAIGETTMGSLATHMEVVPMVGDNAVLPTAYFGSWNSSNVSLMVESSTNDAIDAMSHGFGYAINAQNTGNGNAIFAQAGGMGNAVYAIGSSGYGVYAWSQNNSGLYVSTGSSTSPVAIIQQNSSTNIGDLLQVRNASSLALDSVDHNGMFKTVGIVVTGNTMTVNPLTVNTNALVVTPTGNIGVGTASPNAALQVNGQILSTEYVETTGTTSVDFFKGNNHTISSAGNSTIGLVNMQNGGSYTILITDPTSRTYTFNNCGTSHWKPAASSTSGQSIYSIMYLSGNCYISWSTGW